MTKEADAKFAVTKGAAYLDSIFGCIEWAKHVDTNILSVNSSEYCICGQLEAAISNKHFDSHIEIYNHPSPNYPGFARLPYDHEIAMSRFEANWADYYYRSGQTVLPKSRPNLIIGMDTRPDKSHVYGYPTDFYIKDPNCVVLGAI